MIRALVLVAALAATAYAEPTRYAVGADLVSSTLFRGVGLDAGMRSDHWGGRVEYAYQQIPSVFLDMDSRDKGWSLSANVVAAAADYWFGTQRDGAYVTVELALKREHLGAPMGGTTDTYRPSVCPGAGYRWSPFANALYIEPRLFLIIDPPPLRGNDMVGTQKYYAPPVIPAGWLVVGAQF